VLNDEQLARHLDYYRTRCCQSIDRSAYSVISGCIIDTIALILRRIKQTYQLATTIN